MWIWSIKVMVKRQNPATPLRLPQFAAYSDLHKRKQALHNEGLVGSLLLLSDQFIMSTKSTDSKTAKPDITAHHNRLAEDNGSLIGYLNHSYLDC